jgi:hypothetical protein
MKLILLLGTVAFFTAANTSFAQGDAHGDPVMGDWQGAWSAGPASGTPLAAQVIALGNGTYRANLIKEFDVRQPAIAVLTGARSGSGIEFTAADDGDLPPWQARIENGAFTGFARGAQTNAFTLNKAVRLSPTLDAQPPEGAVVLLGPETADLQATWQRDNGQPCGWKLLPQGVMQCVRGSGSVISRRQFGDHRVHLEFRTPFEPRARGQGRGNSGVYLHGRYEVQVLDSYGLEGASNECGGIYNIAAPTVNMCAPPLQWQTYDITFLAPVIEGGNVVRSGRITVLHNGVLIHDAVEVPRPTAAAPPGSGSNQGGLYLQDHGHPVEFRNIWVVEL